MRKKMIQRDPVRVPGKRPGVVKCSLKGVGCAPCKQKYMSEGFTLVLCISKKWCMNNFFAAFNDLSIDMDNCHLLMFDNSHRQDVLDELIKWFDDYKSAFKSVRIYKSWRYSRGRLLDADSVEWEYSKQKVIYDMQTDIMEQITTERFVLLEDDTLPPYKEHPEVVMRLLSLLDSNPRCGVATAIATGRSAIPWVRVGLGVWYVRREGDKLLWKVSPNPRMRGVHRVDSCGWYCCASYKALWAKALKDMLPYIRDIPPWALDVMQTHNIVLQGKEILADFSMWCAHMHTTQDGMLFWGKKQAKSILSIWLPEWKEYTDGRVLEGEYALAKLRQEQKKRDGK